MTAMSLRLEEIIESKRRIEQENPLWFHELWAGYDWSVDEAIRLLKKQMGEPN
jgi:hypothetical protein